MCIHLLQAEFFRLGLTKEAIRYLITSGIGLGTHIQGK